MQKVTATLENCLAVFYKTKDTHIIRPSSHAPWYLPKWIESLHPHKDLHTYIYTSCIHNCQNLEATKIFFIGEWVNKLWYIQTVAYYSTLKMTYKRLWKDLKETEKTWRKLKYTLWSERSQSKKSNTMKRLEGNWNAFYEVREASPRSLILYDSNYMTFWVRGNYGDSKKINGCQGLGWEEGWTGRTWRFLAF